MRVLLAEDDLTTLTFVNGLLEKWGFEVVVAQDGRTAWETLLGHEAPQLVIMDWMMPELDGLDVIRMVRSRITELPPYIILLTSKSDKGDVITGLESGANDYITKPFAFEELFARVRVGERSVQLQNTLFETLQSLADLARHDPLTGILNRRAILEQLARELSRTKRGWCASLGVGFLDIDKFKLINDQHGHQVGDEVIRAIANLFSGLLRTYDSFGRLGGDEFLVITPVVKGENAQAIYERISLAVGDLNLPTASGPLKVSISLGVVILDPDCTLDIDQILDQADKAMYQAKYAGGNRVYFALPGNSQIGGTGNTP